MALLHVINTDGTFQSEEYQGELTYGTPSWEHLKSLMKIAPGDLIEHVSVLWKGKRAHMFVDEEGIMHKLARNEKATRIYYNATFKRFGRALYNDLSIAPKFKDRAYEDPGFQIVGPAVLWEGDME